MSRLLNLGIGLGIGILSLATLSHADYGHRRWQKDLPPMVGKYFEMQYPFAKITGITRTTENGEDFYEIHSKDYGQRRTVFFRADGTMEDVRETIPVCDLPRYIRHDIREVYPHARIRSVTKNYHWSDITFDVVVRTPGREYHRLAIAFDGRVIGTPT